MIWAYRWWIDVEPNQAWRDELLNVCVCVCSNLPRPCFVLLLGQCDEWCGDTRYHDLTAQAALTRGKVIDAPRLAYFLRALRRWRYGLAVWPNGRHDRCGILELIIRQHLGATMRVTRKISKRFGEAATRMKGVRTREEEELTTENGLGADGGEGEENRERKKSGDQHTSTRDTMGL